MALCILNYNIFRNEVWVIYTKLLLGFGAISRKLQVTVHLSLFTCRNNCKQPASKVRM